MTKHAYSAVGHSSPERKRVTDFYVALALSLLLSALIPLFMVKTNFFIVITGALLFFTLSAILLLGNVFSRSVHCFFLIQYIISYFIPFFSSAIIGISLLFFPLAFGRKNDFDLFRVIPNTKPLALMLLGGTVSLIYLSIANYGEFKYFLRYDFYFLLGLIFTYELYLLFRLKILDPKNLVECIGLSAAVIICFLIALYIRRGGGLMFSERFGLTVIAGENPNILAMYIDMALPCAFFTAFFEKRNLTKKILFYGLSLFYVYILFLTVSRGSLLGIVMLIAYVVWRKRSTKLLLAVSVCAVVVFSTIGLTVIQRTFRPSATDMMSNVGRIELLHSAVGMMKDNHYFFGVGMDNFRLMKYDYGIPQWFDIRKTMKSHNLFVDIWLGWGILGLLGWLFFNAAMIKSIFRKNKDCAMANAVVFAILAFSAHGLVDSACGHLAIMNTYCALLGIGLFLMTRIDNDVKNESALLERELKYETT